MTTQQEASQRMNFFEALHQQFLYLKGYGTYTYITSHDVDQLYDCYLAQQKELMSSISRQHSEINFIRTFIKSL